jgi:hypothetical protein
LIIAICAALNAAATPLLESPNPPVAPTAAWVSDARNSLATCQNDVGFLTRLGRMLLAMGQTEEAAEHLERALLLAPDDAEALRAFAAALGGLGDGAAARQLMAMAPGAAPQTTTQTQWREAWSLTAGMERNLLGVSSVSSLTLTLPGLEPGQPVLITLPIDSSAQARGGGYGQAAASLQWLRRTVSAGASPVQDDWVIQLGARTRQSPQVLPAGSVSVDAAGIHQRRHLDSAWGHHAAVFAAHLQSRTGVTFTQSGLGAGVDWFGVGCPVRLGVEWVNRLYPANPVLDGRQSVAQLQLACHSMAHLAVRAGQDKAMALRPGGDQQLLELRLRGTAGRWAWDMEWARIHDAKGYSALLDSGARRQQVRRSIRIEHVAYDQRPYQRLNCSACRGLQLLWGVELQHRRSNIELFKNNNLGLFATIQWTK